MYTKYDLIKYLLRILPLTIVNDTRRSIPLFKDVIFEQHLCKTHLMLVIERHLLNNLIIINYCSIWWSSLQTNALRNENKKKGFCHEQTLLKKNGDLSTLARLKAFFKDMK